MANSQPSRPSPRRGNIQFPSQLGPPRVEEVVPQSVGLVVKQKVPLDVSRGATPSNTDLMAVLRSIETRLVRLETAVDRISTDIATIKGSGPTAVLNRKPGPLTTHRLPPEVVAGLKMSR